MTVFAIPSYKRSSVISNKTLPLLNRLGVKRRDIRIFVADDKERYEYSHSVGDYRIIVGVPGMMAIRNFMTDYFDEGQAVVFIDDDLDDLLTRVDSQKTAPLKSLQPILDTAFGECERCGARLWGVYPVLNPMFMKPTVTTDLRYVVGCLYGCLNDRSIHVTMDDKEDFERSILYYRKHGATVRVNYVAPKTAYYVQPGGMQETRTESRVRESAVALTKMFPSYCTLYTKKKSGHWEVRLKDKALSRIAKERRP